MLLGRQADRQALEAASQLHTPRAVTERACPASTSACHPAGFVGELDGELSVEPGERVKVHSEVEGWARVIRLSDNRTGLVPSWAVATD